ncbi:hypothetical protein [Abyssisolibacter fermentans]|uniref:hypothetical protein n=1 Tax=Abyssisolibacter fermentans TaxID=1766203 RepID=UPI00082F1798|nr:hypothetical protein [Abyssisolibacter fermentans]
MSVKVNDNMILNVKEIFRLIHNFQYEEAFLLSSEIMERKDNGDQLFHEWVKALAEFFTYGNKNTAIKLLEEIKPNKLENEIQFRIINSLMCFYIEIGNEQAFLKYKKEINSNLHKLDSEELLVKIMCNFTNGYYEFKNYKKSLEYSEKSIKIAQKYRLFGFNFSLLLIIKIMSLLYLGEITKAKNLKKDYETFLKITNTISDKKYLEKTLKIFYKEVANNEKIINKKTI